MPAGDLRIISAEAEVPYNRPPLSMAYLAGKKSDEDLLINPAEFYEKHGIGEGRVSSVKLKSGKILSAGLAISGIGAVPNTEYSEATTLEIDDGIVVDQFLETSVKGIFAAGDVARYPDPRYHKSRRVEHWDNARAQGEHAGRVMAAAFVMGRPDQEGEVALEWIGDQRQLLDTDALANPEFPMDRVATSTGEPIPGA